MKVIRLLCSPRNHRDRSRYGSIPGKGEGMAEPLRRAVADSLDILQGFPYRVNRRSSWESAPDPRLRDLLTRAGHVWGDEKLGLPLVSSRPGIVAPSCREILVLPYEEGYRGFRMARQYDTRKLAPRRPDGH